ncbi:hypothetical protein CN425_22745 [Bacillus cereus]|uniref:Core-binding (CB) domain-containing protein n=1 Tax=Bacillus cereus TaxID=1396 RepID=A0A2A9U224_BACCE|nr:hypothetical protein [Bacillus cereus]EJS70762.1 hypothetical protein ICU_01693 [Bacillus cereus BAG2X1-1]EJS76938.1 hypothetical protein ICY_01564 [Bacillus cereus BAG2X1-3]PEA07432.1 hypothetical protein CON38_22780 [Bacillus cereus]PEV97621.1 hypothetical protein CN425_22745 [Bacillus cereus]PFI15982.1 hypothetical protein COI75_22605 [Bacillus cereus]
MELEEVIEEYLYHCIAKGFTQRTIKNKRQEMKQLKRFLMDEKRISKLESVNNLHQKAYMRLEYEEALQ